MLSLRLVIDTNVLVSAALKSEGLQRTTFLLAITKPARLYVSPPILEEYAEVLSRPELSIRKGLRLQLLQLIKNRGRLVTPSRRIEVTSDPDDNIFVECRCGACRLSRYRQSQALSAVLEKYEDHHAARVRHPGCAASDSLIGGAPSGPSRKSRSFGVA